LAEWSELTDVLTPVTLVYEIKAEPDMAVRAVAVTLPVTLQATALPQDLTLSVADDVSGPWRKVAIGKFGVAECVADEVSVELCGVDCSTANTTATTFATNFRERFLRVEYSTATGALPPASFAVRLVAGDSLDPAYAMCADATVENGPYVPEYLGAGRCREEGTGARYSHYVFERSTVEECVKLCEDDRNCIGLETVFHRDDMAAMPLDFPNRNGTLTDPAKVRCQVLTKPGAARSGGPTARDYFAHPGADAAAMVADGSPAARCYRRGDYWRVPDAAAPELPASCPVVSAVRVPGEAWAQPKR
jgi:hypothetical protein